MQLTSSWDDGYRLDLRVADLLDRTGCPGIFYVCPAAQHGAELLTEQEVRTLGERHTIGAHSLTHPRLTTLDDAALAREIRGSKEWVEAVTGRPCTSFCYPYGAVDGRVRDAVEAAGFHDARTTERWRFGATDPFRTPVSIQIAPYPLRRRFHPMWKILDPLGPLREGWPHVRRFGLPLRSLRSWLGLACALFDWAESSDQPVFHLYGHSREVERYGMWNELEQFLTYVRRSPSATKTHS